jgi:hypothetical protein
MRGRRRRRRRRGGGDAGALHVVSGGAAVKKQQHVCTRLPTAAIMMFRGQSAMYRDISNGNDFSLLILFLCLTRGGKSAKGPRHPSQFCPPTRTSVVVASP